MKEMDDMEVWKSNFQQDINDLKQGQNQLKTDVQALQLNDKLQDKDIGSLQAMFSEIKDDTNWIRRKITGAFITAVVTAVVGGIIGIVIANIF